MFAQGVQCSTTYEVLRHVGTLYIDLDGSTTAGNYFAGTRTRAHLGRHRNRPNAQRHALGCVT